MRFYRETVVPYEGEACLPWRYSTNGNGYGMLWIDGRHFIVSRLLCELVHGPAPTPDHEAAHSCGKGHEGCVNKHHLRWATVSENHMDRVIHDTHQRGERHPLVKLTEGQVHEIRALRGQLPQTAIAAMFGIGRVQVSRIQRRKRWAWLD